MAMLQVIVFHRRVKLVHNGEKPAEPDRGLVS